MRNVMLTLAIGTLFFGCKQHQVTVSDASSMEKTEEKNRERSKKYLTECHVLQNGYLVCPKERH